MCATNSPRALLTYAIWELTSCASYICSLIRQVGCLPRTLVVHLFYAPWSGDLDVCWKFSLCSDLVVHFFHMLSDPAGWTCVKSPRRALLTYALWSRQAGCVLRTLLVHFLPMLSESSRRAPLTYAPWSGVLNVCWKKNSRCAPLTYAPWSGKLAVCWELLSCTSYISSLILLAGCILKPLVVYFLHMLSDPACWICAENSRRVLLTYAPCGPWSGKLGVWWKLSLCTSYICSFRTLVMHFLYMLSDPASWICAETTHRALLACALWSVKLDMCWELSSCTYVICPQKPPFFSSEMITCPMIWNGLEASRFCLLQRIHVSTPVPPCAGIFPIVALRLCSCT